MNQPIKAKTPTKHLVERYISEFENNSYFKQSDIAIGKLFRIFPMNNDLSEILLKVAVVNKLYSTNIYADYSMAQHILDQNIDDHLKSGSPLIVDKIARVTFSGKKIHFYSFATKYCSWHNQKHYPIYDSYVDRILWHYKKKDGFFEFTRNDLRDYLKYKQILDGFCKHFKLTNFSLKQIDKFLWIHGRELYS